MKRLTVIFLSLMLILSFSFSAYAVTGVVTLTEDQETADVDVYGLYEEKKESNYDTDVFEDGEAHVEIGDTQIDVVIDDYDGYDGYIRLVIVLIDEADGQIYLDFADMYDETYDEFYAFDIFFVDENYEVIQANLTFTVTFTNLSELETTPDFHYVDDDFNAYNYPAITTTNTLTFTSNITGFYVVAYNAPVEDVTDITGEVETTETIVTDPEPTEIVTDAETVTDTTPDDEASTTQTSAQTETTQAATEETTEEETTSKGISGFVDSVIKTGDTNFALFALIILISSITVTVVVIRSNRKSKREIN